MTCRAIEVRISLNGITEQQLFNLFRRVEMEGEQITIKRISDPRFTLSPEDLILKGNFSNKFLKGISTMSLSILAVKYYCENISDSIFHNYAALSSSDETGAILVGVTLLPLEDIRHMIGFEDNLHFIRLLISTRAGSLLKPLLVIKPKGIIRYLQHEHTVEIVYPAHRLDLMSYWLEKITSEVTDFAWISGETSELPSDVAKSIGSIDLEKMESLDNWLQQSLGKEMVNIANSNRAALKILDQE